ncbi:MAG: PfkB family carbohydrate kinase, partial [Lentisphaeria bacterium]|nr:PfkB family carbohydrate kinase [Lentisphaeria bacterium]
MRLNMEPRPVLAVCLNPAWQKILTFRRLRHGEVNRATMLQECGGGKGVNVVRVLRRLKLPAAAAVFRGGDSGRKLLAELTAAGAEVLSVATSGQTRTCITVISQENREVTELIEPSNPVTPAETSALRELLVPALGRFGAVALSGTTPPGVDGGVYAGVAARARAVGVPVVLDAVKDIEETLQAGVAVLKVNAGELRQVAGVDD